MPKTGPTSSTDHDAVGAGQEPLPRRLAVDGRVLADQYHGIGRLAEMCLRRLAEDPRFDVTVFVRPGQPTSRFDLDAVIEGGGHARSHFDLPLTSPLQWVRWPAALRRVDADAVLFPYSLGAAVSGRARRFSFVHDCIMERDVRFAPDRRTRWLYMLHTAVVAHRTRVLTRSEAAARDIERFYRVPVKAWQVVPGGVELDFGSLAAPDRRIAGAELPATYLLHVGARRPHKNVVTLVRALALLPPDHHLVLVGAVDDRVPDPVPRVARELGVADRVLHLPRVSEADLHTLYAAARVFTFPSLDEGLGLPLLEAMVVGVPVVASDIPVFREVSGGGALLVPPEDPAAWASAVRAVEEPGRRQALVAAGRAQVRRSTWDLTVDRLVAALLHG